MAFASTPIPAGAPDSSAPPQGDIKFAPNGGGVGASPAAVPSANPATSATPLAAVALPAHADDDEPLHDILSYNPLNATVQMFGCCGISLNADSMGGIQKAVCPFCNAEEPLKVPNLAVKTAIALIERNQATAEIAVLASEVKTLHALLAQFQAGNVKDFKVGDLKRSEFTSNELLDPLTREPLKSSAVAVSCCGASYNNAAHLDGKSSHCCSKPYKVTFRNKALGEALTVLGEQNAPLNRLRLEIQQLQAQLKAIPLGHPAIGKAAHAHILKLLRVEKELARLRPEVFYDGAHKVMAEAAVAKYKAKYAEQKTSVNHAKTQQQIQLDIYKRQLEAQVKSLSIADKKGMDEVARISGQISRQFVLDREHLKTFKRLKMIAKRQLHEERLKKATTSFEMNVKALTLFKKEKAELFGVPYFASEPKQKAADLALHAAVAADDYETAKACLEPSDPTQPKADPNIRSLIAGKAIYEFPIHIVVGNGSLEMVRLLLEHKADVNSVCRKEHFFAVDEEDSSKGSAIAGVGSSLLVRVIALAALRKTAADVAIADYVLSRAELNIQRLQTPSWENPIAIAVFYGSLVLVKKLIEVGFQLTQEIVGFVEISLKKPCDEAIKGLVSKPASVSMP